MAQSVHYAQDFVGGSYDYAAKGESAQRCVNLFPEQIENPSGKTNFCLRSVKALRSWRNLPQVSGTCRGLYFAEGAGRLFGVFGTTFWLFEQGSNVPTKIGSVAAGTGRVSIADNGLQIAVADGYALHVADVNEPAATIATTYTSASIPTFGGLPVEPRNVVSLGRMFFVDGSKVDARRGTIFYTQKNSTTFTDVDGVPNYFDAASMPDDMVALAAVGSRLYSLRARSFDVYALGDVEIVSRVADVSAEIGCASKSSVASVGNDLFWLGSAAAGHNSVWLAQGASAPVRVSTNAIEEALQGLDLADAIGYTFAERGHLFYALSVQAIGKTWVFDLATRLWHERADRDWDAGENRAWAPAFAATAWDGVVLFGCDNAIKVLEGNEDDEGKPVYRLRVSPVYWAEAVPVVVRDFLLDMEVATIKDLSARPVAMLSVSTDGGRTFYDLGWRSIGQTGQFLTELDWQNVGFGRGFIASVAFTEPCDISVFGARLVIETGSVR